MFRILKNNFFIFIYFITHIIIGAQLKSSINTWFPITTTRNRSINLSNKDAKFLSLTILMFIFKVREQIKMLNLLNKPKMD